MMPGQMGPGMMGGQGGFGPMGPGMMGSGMMGPGFGPGFGGDGMRQTDRALTTDEARDILEGRLAWMGNPNLKVGNVEEVDDQTLAATIVTQEGSLVQRFRIDRQTGQMRPAG